MQVLAPRVSGNLLAWLGAHPTIGRTFESDPHNRSVRGEERADAHSKFSANIVSFVALYACVGMREAQLEQALSKAVGTGKLFKLRSLRRDFHEPADAYIVRGADLCLQQRRDGRSRGGVISASNPKHPLTQASASFS
jgi:hypothetical protein